MKIKLGFSHFQDLGCPLGFEQVDGKCEDINECQTQANNCLDTQRCDNTIGSFVCVRYVIIFDHILIEKSLESGRKVLKLD